MMTLKYGSDCSGIEAPFIALRNLLSTIDVTLNHSFACDNNKYVRSMINNNFNPDIVYNDVFDRNPHNMPDVDIYSCGFPCQTFSTAGKRDGFNDARGTVFFAIHDYIKIKLPKICVLENVKGLLTHNNGETFATIITMLKGIGIYQVYWKLMSPHEHNWPQYRPRVFIICIRQDILITPFQFPQEQERTLNASELLDNHVINFGELLTPFERDNLEEHRMNVKAKYGDNINQEYYFIDIGASPSYGRPRHEIVPCLKASRCNYYVTKLRRKMTIFEIERVQGFYPLNQVVSDTQYRKMLGNSMCVPLVWKLFEQIFRCTNLISSNQVAKFRLLPSE
jgi:DNA (cytosine-5)-methyltransferase 1